MKQLFNLIVASVKYILIPISYILHLPVRFTLWTLESSGFVHRSRLQHYIHRVTNDLKKRHHDDKERALIKIKTELEEIMLFELSEKDAIIQNILDEKQEAIEQVDETRRTYYSSLKGMKTNARISTELARASKRFLDSAGSIYNDFGRIQQDALRHKDKIMKNDRKVKEKLGLDI